MKKCGIVNAKCGMDCPQPDMHRWEVVTARLSSADTLAVEPILFSIQHSAFGIRRSAFSLIELMIGIIILGLGMVMVATMYPVAWERTRELSEYTTQRAAASNTHAILQTIGRISRPHTEDDSVLDASGFLGDLTIDRENSTPVAACPLHYLIGGDTWVHALNAENIRIVNRGFVAEDSWRLETADGSSGYLGNRQLELPAELTAVAFFSPQLSFAQRLHPFMGARTNVDASGRFTGDDVRWDEELDTRRYFVGVLHRMRNRLPLEEDDPGTPNVSEFMISAESAVTTTRVFDVYYVTLHRPRPTNRYARQAGERGSSSDPCTLDGALRTPQPAPADEDVMFPVPWRVQIEIPGVNASDLRPKCRESASGLPTEVYVPPRSMSASNDVKSMLAGLFPGGSFFVDEVTGEVFRVSKVRRTGAALEQSVLTLDREIVVEDVDLTIPDPRCELPCVSISQSDLCSLDPSQEYSLDPGERIRTVWVYPPPVQASRPGANVVTFDGPSPVVGIDVLTLTLTP